MPPPAGVQRTPTSWAHPSGGSSLSGSSASAEARPILLAAAMIVVALGGSGRRRGATLKPAASTSPRLWGQRVAHQRPLPRRTADQSVRSQPPAPHRFRNAFSLRSGVCALPRPSAPPRCPPAAPSMCDRTNFRTERPHECLPRLPSGRGVIHDAALTTMGQFRNQEMPLVADQRRRTGLLAAIRPQQTGRNTHGDTPVAKPDRVGYRFSVGEGSTG